MPDAVIRPLVGVGAMVRGYGLGPLVLKIYRVYVPVWLFPQARMVWVPPVAMAQVPISAVP
jgi:hypothetical protein